jgi:hypothetical protein
MFHTRASYELLLAFLVIEITLLISLIFSIILKRIFTYYSIRHSLKKQKKLTEIFIQFLQYGGAPIPSSHYRLLKSIPDLVIVMETFNHRFKESNWGELKNELAKLYLLPKARKLALSPFWIKRNLAARCFSLAPQHKDEPLIIKLIEDQNFLVRSVASIAAVQLNSQKGIAKILTKMSQETGYARFFYRDILLQASAKAFERIEQIAASSKQPALHLACLEILTGKTTAANLTFLHKDLKSSNAKIRLAAVKVMAANLPKSFIDELMYCLNDPDETIRAEAATGLINFPSKKNREILEKLLQDEDWIVRLSAAKALKRMDPEGVLILRKQKKQHHEDAYAAAQYVLKFT